MEVNFPSPLNSINEFDIMEYINIPFYLNKKRENKIYYRCKMKKKTKCTVTCKVTFLELKSAKIVIEGEHNHPVQIINRLSKKIVQKIDDSIQRNTSEKPSVIEKEFLKGISSEELRTLALPTRSQISYRKSKFIHAQFPTPDHIWNSMLNHGNFEGSTKFIRNLSLVPFLCIMMTTEGLLHLSKKNSIIFIDGTHSTCSPTLCLLCFMVLTNDGNCMS